MAFRPLDPKSSASASSATFARGLQTQDSKLAGLGQKLDQFLDTGAARDSWRAVAAGAGLPFQAQVLAATQHVQTGMRVALHGENTVAGVEKLLENRDSEAAPEQLAIGARESVFSFIGESDHCMFQAQALRGEAAQLFKRCRDRLRLEAGG